MSRPRGRPRDTDADQRILSATLEGLATVGYEAMSIDGIASQAGVAKTTLYRRWRTKEELVLCCLQERAMTRSPPSTGDWREDIYGSVRGLIAEANTPEGKAWNSVLAAAQNNPELHLYFSREDEPVVRIRKALLEGVATSELRADLDIDLTMDLLVAVVVFRTLVLREPVHSSLAQLIVDIVLDGATAVDSPKRGLQGSPSTTATGRLH